MESNLPDREIYIVLSQTGSIVSRIIRRVTGKVYNHASISTDASLDTMYSFGRVHPYNPVWGGFVKESPNYGTFRRFSNTEARVLAIPVNDEQYWGIKKYLENMYQDRGQYYYNYAGLFLALFHKAYWSKNHYYCSEFVRDVLQRFQVISKDTFSGIVHPESFLQLSGCKIVYEGCFLEYQECILQYKDS